jgi:predicted DCC family thiol-disulfide oxidoreductase YuxK
VRSGAVLELLDTLGGLWRVVALAMRLMPVSLRDRAYDTIATRRYRWFGRRDEACPLLPPALRGRIEA